ncbi:MAG: PEP-CTERM sorting domain-containing protein [Candidatus Nealsonbacteria bacterium]|nr:PEP-CTERM sorting domain-containing protein [Candidatus Nealsonbacteria bacterium]
MKRVATTLTVAVLCSVVSAASAATITLGTYNLLENTPDQKIPVYIVGSVGDPAVAGMNFNVQIADGGPEAPGGSIDGPGISYLQLVDDPVTPDYALYHTDIYGPTFFDSISNWGHFGVGSPFPQFFARNTAFTSGGQPLPVGVETLLAVVTVDTTGFFVGDANDPWDLKIGDTLNGSTALLDTSPLSPTPIPLEITEGQITLVSEPSTLALVLIGLLGVAVLLWKR